MHTFSHFLQGTFAKIYFTKKCSEYSDRGAAIIGCDARRSRKAAHAATQVACACAATFDYAIPDSVAAPPVTMVEEYLNFKQGGIGAF